MKFIFFYGKIICCGILCIIGILLICFTIIIPLSIPPSLRLDENEYLYLEKIGKQILSSDSNLLIEKIEKEKFRDLGVESIFETELGVYFKCWSFCLFLPSENGFFIPRNSYAFEKKIVNGEYQDGDYFYRHISNEIYYYCIGG